MIQIRKPHSVRSLSLIALPPLVAVLVAALAASAPAPAMAQDSFPTRPVTVIVPFPPGGGADLAMRPLAAQMEKLLKQPV